MHRLTTIALHRYRFVVLDITFVAHADASLIGKINRESSYVEPVYYYCVPAIRSDRVLSTDVNMQETNLATLHPRWKWNTTLCRPESWTGWRETRGRPDRRGEVLHWRKFHQTKRARLFFHGFYGRRPCYRYSNLSLFLPFQFLFSSGRYGHESERIRSFDSSGADPGGASRTRECSRVRLTR